MDIDAVRALAHRFDEVAGQLDALSAATSASLYAVEWEGPDATTVQADWELRHQPALARAGVHLRDGARALLREADGQVTASASVTGVTSQLHVAAPLNTQAPIPTYALSVAPSIPRREFYQEQLYRELGVDDSFWDTEQGLAFNDDRIRRTYDYYGEAFARRPELQWAGMAKLAAGPIYAGIQDVHVMRGMSEASRRTFLRELDLPANVVEILARATAGELEFFEDKLVDMQKQIFVDLGWQLMAYERGGIEALRELDAAKQLPPGMRAAWEDIASGQPERVQRGNKDLLYREQWDILQDDWNDLKSHHGPVGFAFTYVVGALAPSPIPDGRPFRQVVDDVTIKEVRVPFGPLRRVPIDTPDLTLDTPVATGNIATWESRWKWIDTELLPDYRNKLNDRPAEMSMEIAQPIEQRAAKYRLVPLPYVPKPHP